jgi:hypothetical protein
MQKLPGKFCALVRIDLFNRLVIWPMRSATRASRVENTFNRVTTPDRTPDSKNIGVSATWMIRATKSKDEI